MQWIWGHRTKSGLAFLLLGGCAPLGPQASPRLAVPNTPDIDVVPAMDLAQSPGIADPQKSALALTSYDEVIALAWGAADLSGMALSHPSLPIPSYVEITRLDTGRTILARVSERAKGLVPQGQLSSAAAELLGLNVGGQQAFRVRRVNPVEQDKLALNQGQPAAARLNTPDILLGVLRKRAAQLKLADAQPGSDRAAARVIDTLTQAAPSPAPKPPMPATREDTPNWGASFVSAPAARQPQTPPLVWYVQIAALSTAQNAQKLAAATGARVSRQGAYFRVRSGPYPDRAAASAALGRLHATGYPEARITR